MSRPLSIAGEDGNPFADRAAATPSTIRLVQQQAEERNAPAYIDAQPSLAHRQASEDDFDNVLMRPGSSEGEVAAESREHARQDSRGEATSSGEAAIPRSSRPFASPHSESSVGQTSSGGHRSIPSDPASRSSMWKGKAKAWDLDLEQGYDERPREGPGGEMYDAADAGADPESGGAYPPVSEEEAEEKRIQETLAMFAAKDMARRRAARASKIFVPAPKPQSASSAATSPTTGGFNLGMGLGLGAGSKSSKRSSMFGFFRLPGSEDAESTSGRAGSKRDSNATLNGYGEAGPPGTTPSDRQRYPNPFDNPYSTAAGAEGDLPSPTRSTQPPIERRPTPIIRTESSPFSGSGGSTSPLTLASRRHPSSTGSAHSDTSLNSLVDSNGAQHGVVLGGDDGSRGWGDPSAMAAGAGPSDDDADGFKGTAWRGGQAAARADAPSTQKRDRWWHALCAWGDDLDDGENQAGRTNPFE